MNDFRLHQGPRLKALPTGQHVLLNELWKRHGGMRPAARKIGVAEHLLNMWRRRGGVPLSHCRKVSLALKVPIHALNYPDVCGLLGPYEGGWRQAVEECDFAVDTEKKILKVKMPEYKE